MERWTAAIDRYKLPKRPAKSCVAKLMPQRQWVLGIPRVRVHPSSNGVKTWQFEQHINDDEVDGDVERANLVIVLCLDDILHSEAFDAIDVALEVGQHETPRLGSSASLSSLPAYVDSTTTSYP